MPQENNPSQLALRSSAEWCLSMAVADPLPDPLLQLATEALDAAKVPIESHASCPHCGTALRLSIDEDTAQ